MTAILAGCPRLGGRRPPKPHRLPRVSRSISILATSALVALALRARALVSARGE